MPELLGRTNRAFPAVWVAPSVSSAFPVADLVAAAVSLGTVIDISASPAALGGAMRGTDAVLMTRGGADIVNAADDAGAGNLISAHILETLSGVGREYVDFYFLRVRQALEEYQLNGALEALEAARDEGLVRYFGLAAEGSAFAVLGNWQFRDAFEVLLVPDVTEEETRYSTLVPLARERRVGVVRRFTSIPGAEALGRDPVLVPVRTAEEVQAVQSLLEASRTTEDGGA